MTALATAAGTGTGAAFDEVGRRGGRGAVRRLAVARLASAGGSQAAQVALAFEVYRRTGSAAWVSAALVASAGVVGLVGPLSGRLGDRLDRRRLVVAAELAGAVGWLMALLAHAPITLVLAALVATAANAPARAATSAAVPNLVSADDLPWANATLATATNAALVVGPLLGGALVGAVGPGAVFGTNAVSFLASAVLVAGIRGPFRAESGEAPAAAGSGAAGARAPGWRALLADPHRRRLYTVTSLTFAAFGLTLVADLPLVDHLGGGSVGYALLTTLWGTGAVVGSLVAGRLAAGRERTALVAGTGAMALSLGSLAVVPGLAPAIAVGAVGGLGCGLAFPPWFSLLQRATTDAQRGRAFALADTLEQTGFIAGMVVAGGAIAVLGPQATYLLPTGLLLGALAVARRL